MVCHAVAQTPARQDVLRTLGKAAAFMHDELSRHGGYVYQWSGDLKLREAEGITDEDTLWVQPPGTPRVGEAFLDSFEATADPKILGYAREAALALAHRQLHSGGWYYSMHFACLKKPVKEHRDGKSGARVALREISAFSMMIPRRARSVS
jgi:hypothetical protein